MTLTDILWLIRNVLTLRGATTCHHAHTCPGKDYFMRCEDCGCTLPDSWPTTEERGKLVPNGWVMVPRETCDKRAHPL